MQSLHTPPRACGVYAHSQVQDSTDVNDLLSLAAHSSEGACMHLHQTGSLTCSLLVAQARPSVQSVLRGRTRTLLVRAGIGVGLGALLGAE